MLTWLGQHGLRVPADVSIIHMIDDPLLLTLGAITARNSGSTVDFTLPIGTQDGTNGVTTTSTTFLNNNVLAGAANGAANGTAFATVGIPQDRVSW